MAGEKLIQKALGVLAKSAPEKFVTDPVERAANLKKFHAASPEEVVNSKWYHGTAREVPNFTNGKPTFVTTNPKFANAFAEQGGIEHDWDDVNKIWVPRAGSEIAPNVMPLHVRAQNPWDYSNPEHVQAVLDRLYESRPLKSEWDRVRLNGGDWEDIELPFIQKEIKGLGHDAFFVNEGGQRNLAVYNPESQLKSATGNAGTFDPDIPRVNEARGGEVEAALHAVRHHLAGGGQAIPPEFTSDAAGAPVDFRPLNFDALRQANAVRVTNRANPDGTTDTDPTAGFSIVSGWNDSMAQHGDPRSTVTWPDNPEAYGTVADMFANNPEWITPHKYRQILHSARELGMPDEQIYAPRKAGGGFLSDLFSGPDFLSTGEAASPTNWGDPESAADFFKADRALRLAREVQASEPARDTPLPPRRPVAEAAPRQQVAAPPPAPAPSPLFIPYPEPERAMEMPEVRIPYTMPALSVPHNYHVDEVPSHLEEDPGFGQAYNADDANRLWATTRPETGGYLDEYKFPELPRQTEINRAVSLAQNLAPAQPEAIPNAADALAAVENLHNSGVYSGEALDKAGEILAAHNRAMFDNIPVDEALRLIRAEGPRMVNQGMPVTSGTTRDIVPLSYAETPAPAPASAAIDQATGKMTARIPEEPHGTALTKQQADYVIRTIAAETSGKSPEETQAIASVILNRINSGKYGSSPEAVLFAKRQFEPWMNPAGANYPMKISPTSQRYLDARAALEAAMAGEDITRGATNFWGPKSQYSLGRDTPEWAVKMPDYTDIGATRFHRPNSPIQMAQAQAQEVPSTGLFAFGTNDPNPQTALKSAQQIYENARRAGIDPVFVLPNSADPRFAPISEALKKYADERGIKYETPGYDPKDPLHITPDTAKEIAKKYPGALVGGDSNSWRLQKYGYGRPVSSPNAFVDKGTGVKLGQVGAGSPDVAKWFGQYVDRLSRGRASGGLVDDALHVVREHHADGEGVGQAPVATDNSERVRAAESAANLAKQIQAYEASMASIRQQPQDIQSMTHAPEKPRAPISVEALGKNREFGSAPYDVAGPLSSFAQGAYDMKTLPLYMYPPTAPLGMAIDTAEGMASGSPTQVAMGALGGPLKVARNVIAPLAVATGVTAPDEAEAGSLSKLFGKMVSPAKRAENLVKFKAGNVEDVPSVVYHGTGNDIHQFDTTKGAWFTDTPSLASEYANKPGGNVVPAHIALKNPIEFVHAEQRKPIGEVISTALSGARDLSAEQINAAKPIVDVLRKRYGKDARPLFEYWNNDPDVTKLFKTLGYDGISAFEKADRKAKTWSIFSPEQAKSAIGNAGTFDPTKARLNEAKGGSVEDRALMLVSRQA